jgi:cellulose synthase/poly-beta-1,6-N-acetylglucosamine synthase-like glycosyltransferase
MAYLVAGLVSTLGIGLIACAIVEAIEAVELLIFGHANDGPAVPKITNRPFVSIHVPICSEPPEVVAGTLMALRKLGYDAFEVLVIDNNTKDDRLWKPVERLCRDLGSRFYFYHLPVWPGFKAGALNFALKHTAPEASLIAVIDADYQTESNYLIDVVGKFEDEKVVFVQTPQDYRNWSLSSFFRMCRWEYWQVFAISMVQRNRHNAILMHGTMGLVRKDTLVRVGGWAEWCLTEDSELGLRLLAQGYRGVYVSKTYGHGLLPFTFGDYKRQRRRWVIGGVQQFKQHSSLFLPWSPAARNLTLMQQFRYLQGWVPWFRCGVIVASVPVSIVVAIAVLFRLLTPDALAVMGIGLLFAMLELVIRQLIVYRAYLALPWRDASGAVIAHCSLTWAIGCGWLAGLTNADQVFQRTPKRRHKTSYLVTVVRGELFAATLTLALGFAVAFRFGLPGLGTTIALLTYAVLLLPSAWMARLSSVDAL